MYLNNITVEADEGDEALAEILEGIQFLCNTVEGTYPMNRDFGISAKILDRPSPAAEQLLSIELKDKIEKFEPRVKVTDITFSHANDGMALCPQISVKLSDNWAEDKYENMDYDEDDV